MKYTLSSLMLALVFVTNSAYAGNTDVGSVNDPKTRHMNKTCYEEYYNVIPVEQREQQTAHQARSNKVMSNTVLILGASGVIAVGTAMATTPGAEAVDAGMYVSSTAMTVGGAVGGGVHSFLDSSKSETDYMEVVKEIEVEAYVGRGDWLRSLAITSARLLAQTPTWKFENIDIERMELSVANAITGQPSICAALDRETLFANIHNAALKNYLGIITK